jgi:tryptophan-rich sensory protein
VNLPKARSTGLLILCLAIPLIIGIAGSLITMPEIGGWYTALHKPWFNPPSWIFGPVWILLYILMGVSLWLIVRDEYESRPVRQAVILFAIQLIANLLWSVLFFGMHLIFAALLGVIVLFILIAATIIAFRRISSTAGWLLVPYLCWTAFASLLTGMIWILN